MAKLSILFGSLLVLLGLAGYLMQSGEKSPTAFIPSGFGLLLLLPGLVAAAKPSLNKHAMHVAALVGLLGTSVASAWGCRSCFPARRSPVLSPPDPRW